MFSAYARLHHTILSQMVNFIDAKAAIAELEKLRFAWGERDFKIRLLTKLSDFYLKDKDYYNALRTLNEQRSLTTGEQKNIVTAKMVKIFEDIFIGNHADDALSPIKALGLYQDFNWLAAISRNYNTITQKLADRLVAVDLLPRAQELLHTLLKRQNQTADLSGQFQAVFVYHNVKLLSDHFPLLSSYCMEKVLSHRCNSPELPIPAAFFPC